MSGKYKGILAIIVSALGFAIMAACVRLCDECGKPISCFEKAFFRNAIAFVVALVIFRRAHIANVFGGMRARECWLLLLRCILGVTGIFTNFYALSHIPIADGQTLNKIAPFCTVVFAWLFLGEKASLRQLAAVVLAFVGTVMVAKPGFAGDAAFPLAMGVVGGLCAGGAYVALRALSTSRISPVVIVMVFSGFSCLASVPFTAFHYVPLNLKQILVLIGAGIGGAIGQFGVTFAYRFAAPREIAVFDYSNILFTAMFGYLLFGQVSDAFSFVGMAVIILAATIMAGVKWK